TYLQAVVPAEHDPVGAELERGLRLVVARLEVDGHAGAVVGVDEHAVDVPDELPAGDLDLDRNLDAGVTPGRGPQFVARPLPPLNPGRDVQRPVRVPPGLVLLVGPRLGLAATGLDVGLRPAALLQLLRDHLLEDRGEVLDLDVVAVPNPVDHLG